MKIQLERINDKVHFRAANESGSTIDLDGGPASGGENEGFRPMETVLAGLAGCSVIDLILIIEKQRMTLENITVDVEAERADSIPSPFTKIHLHYSLWGTLQENKVKKAVELAVEKYCSVAVMLAKSAAISHSFAILE